MDMWSDIQYDPKQINNALRRRCDSFENQLYLYTPDVFTEMEDSRHIYGSLKTEGSTLTFVETSMLIKNEIPRGAKNRDILECVSLSNALKEARSLIGNVPFIDFNGRTSQLFECYILGEAGYPFISLKEEDISDYISVLREGTINGKTCFEPYIEYVYNQVLKRFEEIEENIITGGQNG